MEFLNLLTHQYALEIWQHNLERMLPKRDQTVANSIFYSTQVTPEIRRESKSK